jgi:hypothetical protein
MATVTMEDSHGDNIEITRACGRVYLSIDDSVTGCSATASLTPGQVKGLCKALKRVLS